jgi:hypothetical protein
MKCPNGLICIDKLNIFFVILLAIVILYGVNKQIYMNVYKNQQTINNNMEAKNNTIVTNLLHQQEQNFKQQQESFKHKHKLLEKEYKEQISELKSQKSNKGKGVHINVPTRGETDDYTQIGMLHKGSINDSSSKPGDNADSVILPLYGKQCYRRSQNWFYYTMSNSYNSMKIPITINGYDCTDDRGCKELNDGDTVTIPSYNGIFTCKIYKNDKYRYIPYIN